MKLVGACLPKQQMMAMELTIDPIAHKMAIPGLWMAKLRADWEV